MNKEELIGKLQMVYVGDKNALNELIGYYDGLKEAVELLKKENQKYKEVIDKAIEYIDILVLGEKENGEPYLFKEDAEGEYLLDILKEVE